MCFLVTERLRYERCLSTGAEAEGVWGYFLLVAALSHILISWFIAFRLGRIVGAFRQVHAVGRPRLLLAAFLLSAFVYAVSLLGTILTW